MGAVGRGEIEDGNSLFVAASAKQQFDILDLR